MFTQQPAQRRPVGNMQPPPANMQPPQSQCEIQAKEKLMQIVYEYLVHSGAQKTADSFKEEVLNNHQNPNVACFKPQESAPGFLHNWFMIFWDLYNAASDRRECEPSQDGKMFCDIFMSGYGGMGGPGMMNGMPGMFPGGPMGMPGPDGMMAGFPNRFAGRGGPPGGMPGGYGMFPPGDPRLAAQRMPPNAMRMPSTSFAGPPGAGMRPAAPGQAMGFRGGPYLDSPNQAFPPGAMMPNGMGTPSAMSMSSPGMPMNVPDGAHPPYMQGGIPSSSSAMPFSMGDATVSMGNGGMAPTGGMDGQQQQMMMMNGEDVKQSPASTPRGMNGGTPAPGSAQSGQPSSGTPGATAQQQHTGDEKPNSNSKTEDDEIRQIKGCLLDDFTPKEEAAEPASGGYF